MKSKKQTLRAPSRSAVLSHWHSDTITLVLSCRENYFERNIFSYIIPALLHGWKTLSIISKAEICSHAACWQQRGGKRSEMKSKMENDEIRLSRWKTDSFIANCSDEEKK
jgi:hypothetical protein